MLRESAERERAEQERVRAEEQRARDAELAAAQHAADLEAARVALDQAISDARGGAAVPAPMSRPPTPRGEWPRPG